MQVQDITLAHTLSGVQPTLPPRITPNLLQRLASGSTLLGGHHESLTIEAPFTRQAIGEVLLGTTDDVQYAVERARRAQQDWAARPMAERAAVLIRLHDLLLERQAEGLDLLQLETGKARYHAFLEYYATLGTARYYGHHGPATLSTHRRKSLIPVLGQAAVSYQPKGVVGIIGPWNYPLLLVLTDAIPALLAGNAVVVKPAESTPFAALWAAQLLYEAGLPPELFHIVPGYGEKAGSALVEEVDYVHFTGSTAVGRIVAAQAAPALKGYSLELGGKNPSIVRHDANLDHAVEGLLEGCFLLAGQTCISTERLYVHESIFDDFVTRFAAATEAMLLNTRYDFSAHMGSLASVEQLDKVSAHVEDAVAKGATVVAGGRPLPEIGPLFYAPTLLTGVRENMDLHREETFGPVAAIYPYTSDEEAIALANDSEYGLNANIWSRDRARARQLASQLAVGMVGINDSNSSTWGAFDAPMGGFKASGVGRRNGPEGLLRFTEPQNVASVLRWPLPSVPLVPGAFDISQKQMTAVVEGAFRLIRHLPGLR